MIEFSFRKRKAICESIKTNKLIIVFFSVLFYRLNSVFVSSLLLEHTNEYVHAEH